MNLKKTMPSKLPPIPQESFDGDKQSSEIKFNKCDHKKVKFENGVLRCPCGVGYAGPNLYELYKLLTK